VTLSSTYVGPTPVDFVEQWDKRQKKRIKISQPFIVKEYNTTMGAVDKFDMLTALYRLEHKSRRWYIRIFYWCLQLAVVNGWLLYRRQCNLLRVEKKNQMDLLAFTASVSESLIKCYKPLARPRRWGRPSSSNTNSTIGSHSTNEDVERPAKQQYRRSGSVQDDIRFDQIGHFPEHRTDKPHCVTCGARIKMGCIKCNVALCILPERNCFLEYHMSP
jgi:hypothetical protein